MATGNPYSNTPAVVPGSYTSSVDIGEGMGPNSAYAVPNPESGGSPYSGFVWGPKLTTNGVDGTPDAHRLQTLPTRDFHPVDEDAFFAGRDADKKARESVTYQDADGWEEKKARKSVGRNPRETPPPETRMTEKLSPSNYTFLRPFDQLSKGNGARHFNGNHFSMADHRREYEILGMQPVRNSRNTYRIEPGPWDRNLVDMPPIEPASPGPIQAVDLPPSGSRSWRL